MKDQLVKDSPVASEVYDNIVDYLAEVDQLASVDYVLINSAARAYAMYLQMWDEMIDKGPVQITKSGYTQKNAYLTAATDFLGQYKDLTFMLGLSPKARKQLGGKFMEKKSKEETDKVKELMKGK